MRLRQSLSLQPQELALKVPNASHQKGADAAKQFCWYWPLYSFTKFCVVLAFACLVAASFPAVEAPHAGMQDGKYGPHFECYPRYEHGWPLRYCEREMDREVASPGKGQNWVPASAWTPWVGAERFSWVALLVDVAVACLTCLLVAPLAQWWRSRRRAIWQLKMLDLLTLLAAFGLLFGWLSHSRSERLREEKLLQAQADGVNFDNLVLRGSAVPAYLPEPVKGVYRRWFDRVIEYYDDGEARLASEFHRLLVLSRPQPDAQLRIYLRRMSQLEAIDFMMVGLHSDWQTPMVGLRDLPPMPNLRGVNLYETDANDEDMEWLAKCPHLERLCLFDTEISDAGVERLSGLRRLRILEIACDRYDRESFGERQLGLTDRSCISISKMQNLEELDLAGKAITDRGVEALGSLKKLKRLGLKTSASQQAVDRLKQQLPGCEVFCP